jgi:hypothetical protein
MKKKHIVLLVIILQSLTSFSQYFYEKGYIVKPSGDTIWGYIRSESFNNLSQRIFFKDKQNNLTSYQPNSLKGFFIAPDHYFESHFITIWKDNIDRLKLPEKTSDFKFIRKIIAGKLAMYQYDATNQYNTLYIKKDNAVLHHLLLFVKQFNKGDSNQKSQIIDSLPQKEKLPITDYVYGKEYLKTMANNMQDWKNYVPKEFSLTKNDIKREVINYNKDVNLADFKILSKSKININLAAYYGVLLNNENILPETFMKAKRTAQTIIDPSYGYQFIVGFSNRTFSKGILLELGYMYQKRDFMAVVANNSDREDYIYNARSNHYFLRLNVNLLPFWRVSPYVCVGLGVGASTVEGIYKRSFQINNIPFEQIGNYDKSTNINQEILVGGFNVFLSKSHALKFEYSPKSFIQSVLPLSASFKIGYQATIF